MTYIDEPRVRLEAAAAKYGRAGMAFVPLADLRTVLAALAKVTAELAEARESCRILGSIADDMGALAQDNGALLARAEDERDAAVKELRDRELHHFEAEKAMAEALNVPLDRSVPLHRAWPDRVDAMCRILSTALTGTDTKEARDG